MRELYAHQNEAADFIASAAGHLLAGEMGTGKTLSAIEGMRRLGARKILVICPAILTLNWKREFDLAGSSLRVLDPRRQPKLINDADVMVVSVDWVRTQTCRSIIGGITWDALIADEAHYLANPESQRTIAAYSAALRVGKVVPMTGTPTPKHAGQLWPHINRTAPERIDNMSYDQFVKTYCTQTVKKFPGMYEAKLVITGNNRLMIPDLRKRLAGWWLRQRKEDVLKNLPPKTVSTVPLPASKADLRVIQDELDPEVYEYIEYMLETGSAQGMNAADEGVARLRRLLAKTKARATAEYANMLLDTGVDCLCIWGWHTEPLRMVARDLEGRGYRVGVINGSTSLVNRDKIVRDFQEGRLDVFIGQIKAAGVGITLTRASRCLFLEESFVPSDNEQAQDRNHRLGQTGHVQVDRLVLEGTIDEAVMRIVEARTSQWTELSKDA